MKGLAAGFAGILALGLGACSSSGSGGSLGSLLAFGAEGTPPLALDAPIEVAECPAVTVAEGGSAMRTGDGANVRSQVSVAEVARECTGRADGTVVIKVGVQLRALLGPGAGAGRFDTPVTITVKRGDQVLASRTRRVAIAIPPGQAETTAVIVEDGLVVPPGTGEYDIEIALRAGPAAAPTRRRAARG